MCGICGVVQLEAPFVGPAVDASVFESMVDLMEHRGPSDSGVYAEDGVSLGVRRLSIVDVEGGHQPFSNEDGSIWAIQNGELFNHLDLRNALPGHSLRSRCDTEIIPHLYEEYRCDFPMQLRGMFAIAVWDAPRRRLVVARDRLGIKPLYYAVAGDALVFASELKPILASGLVDVALDPDAVDAYLTLGYFPTPLTPLRGVKKLPPGHRLVVENGSVGVEQYWSYPAAAPEAMSLDEAAVRLTHELEESVRLRLMSDVPLGAMLSGGLDSSLIVALMARQLDRPVQTFSVGFAEDPNNELEAARATADWLGTEHHELELSLLHDAVPLDELAWFLDEPLADLSALGFYALSRLAAERVTVALSGQGADELFGGYAAHRNAEVVGAVHRIPGGRRLASLATGVGPAKTRRAARIIAAANPAERFLLQQSLAGEALRSSIYRSGFEPDVGRAAGETVAGIVGGMKDEPLRVAFQIHARLALVDDMLQYFDRMSMAHSLEVRVPFLDHQLVEFVATIPDRLKVQRLVTKRVLRHAARGLVPDAVVTRRKIGFFNKAMSQWVQTQGRKALRERVLDPAAATGDIFDRAELERLIDADATHNGSRLLIAILMLELWLSTVVPRATGAGTKVRDRVA